MSKPLIVSYNSEYGNATTSYHVINEVYYNRLSSPTTTVSASIYLDKSSYQASKTPLKNYSFTFDIDTTSVGNVISQSYETLKGFTNGNILLGENKSEFSINFSSSTYDI